MAKVFWASGLAGLMLSLVGCDAPQQEGPGSSLDYDLSCGGTEPFWSLDLEGSEARFHRMDEEEITYLLTGSEGAEGRTDFEVISGEDVSSGTAVSITLQKTGTCSDGMSDFTYDYEVLIQSEGGPTYVGCCGRQEG